MPEETEEKKPIDEFYDQLSTFDWPDIKKTDNEVYVDRANKIVLFKQSRSTITINFVWYDRENDEFKYRSNPKTLIFNKDTNIHEFLYIGNRKYKLTYGSEIKDVLELDQAIEKIDIKKSYRSINVSKAKKEVKVPLGKFRLIRDEVEKATKKSNSYGESVKRHYLNEIIRKYRRKSRKQVTTFQKGEFDFLVKRFNLGTKKKEGDFNKYLDKKDNNDVEVNGEQKNVNKK
jgi:hypothetical protein